ncbi:Type 1 glutamine amidotransferase-like domain-containing protein [Patescibacteria group bacterium]
MMHKQLITCVLHGGETSRKSPYNDLFFKQFTELVDKKTIKILMCYWSRDKSKWDELLKRDSEKVLKQTNKKVVFTLVGSVKDLYKQLADNDVLYVAGGDAELIEPFLPNIKDLKKHLQGKVYIGSSMGAFIVSKHYVLSFDSQDSNSVHDGIGMIPINTLCHWDPETRKSQKISLLKKKTPNIPILTLDECKHVTFVI